MENRTFETEIGGQKISVELTSLTEQANGSTIVRQGDTVVLATAVLGKRPREGGDFFPLMVDYEEKHYAAGRIIGSRFFKRETRPTEEAILVARLIDRTIRPRFNQQIRHDVQVVITVLSLDDKNDPDIPALLAASSAVLISDIPWDGPIAGVRVGKIGEGLKVNPTFEERAVGSLDLVVAGTEERINMLEGSAQEIPEDEFLAAIDFTRPYIQELIRFQKDIAAAVKPVKKALPLVEPDEKFKKELKEIYGRALEEALFGKNKKQERMSEVNILKERVLEETATHHPQDQIKIKHAALCFEELVDETVHRKAIEENLRVDGRAMDELRPLEAMVGLLPRTHGSGIFVRGQTKALSVLTLGAPGDEQVVEGMEVVGKKRFMHHYNFPPFSVGEVGPMRGPGRRDIGHGALVERSLRPLIPPRENFPYTIRIVSEILSSNGSSSMASVCGSTLALMDGGVAIKEPAAGIAMGLMMSASGGKEPKYKILTDIQGPEDYHGDMDLKVAGTKNGVTGIQMDVKIEGVTLEILRDTFAQSRKAREEILAKMLSVIAKPRENLSPYAPRIITLQINPEKIRNVIGPGGKVINEIISETGVDIDIEDSGLVFITSTNEESAKKALDWIKNLTREVKMGEIFEGRVVKILDFGAFVEILPGQEGMVHISELAPRRVEKVEDILRVGDIRTFKVVKIENGKIGLSLKALSSPPEKPYTKRNE